ncbi:MAG: hypothetical protein PHQ80_00725 [Candidatus ainarchaeum sp.]|nr:hypothetical protein [Candidatus ainarchaeum sp.]MDD5096106.1 hypothetical protein [Candidatus ainarchaeum sp.]
MAKHRAMEAGRVAAHKPHGRAHRGRKVLVEGLSNVERGKHFAALAAGATDARRKARYEFCAGEAFARAASDSRNDRRRAGRLHEIAGDRYFDAANGQPGRAVALAREQYGLALEMGGYAKVLNRKIAACDRMSAGKHGPEGTRAGPENGISVF